jgi:raffinose/stachyose/melibiose transport system permease protein
MVVIDSVKSNAEIMNNPIALAVHITFDNYKTAFQIMNYPSAFLNTLLITVASVALIILFSSMTAYYLARHKGRLTNAIFIMFVLAMLVPFQAIMIPLVSIYGALGILSTKLTLMYMYIGFGAAMGIFIFHGFIKSSVPISLEEAANLDGCNRLQTFFYVVFPILSPVISTVVVLDVLWIWNDYLLPSLILTKPGQLTLPLSVFAFSGEMSVNFGPLIASLVMTIIPILIIYIALQKYIIEGVTAGAVKS